MLLNAALHRDDGYKSLGIRNLTDKILLEEKVMKKLRLALSSTIAAAGILALSGMAVAQTRSASGEVVVSNCPQPRVTNKKISEDEAQDLAQRYADKNFKDFKVARPGGTSRYGRAAAHGGGYLTVCHKNGKTYHSVEYSIDVKNPKGDTRILSVDQFGNVTEFRGIEAAAR